VDKPVYEKLLAELLTPELEQADPEVAAEKFGKRYLDYYNDGFGVSLPDNPMGNLRFTSTEILEFLELPVERVIVHLNSFHRKQDLDQIVDTAETLGVQTLLCVSGDGNPNLHRLEPEELGFEATAHGAATSVELIKYIKQKYPDRFKFGVAFNPYEKPDIEFMKMERKMEVGFDFIGTQLYLPPNLVEGFEYFSPYEELEKYNKPIVFGIWTPSHGAGDDSEKTIRRTDLLLECITSYYEPAIADALKAKLIAEGYNSEAVMEEIKEKYSSMFPAVNFYFSMPIRKKMVEWL